eukprot:2050213-Lingulodinium_polyedra.AAC.1
MPSSSRRPLRPPRRGRRRRKPVLPSPKANCTKPTEPLLQLGSGSRTSSPRRVPARRPRRRQPVLATRPCGLLSGSASWG